jgi:hypothetical protein
MLETVVATSAASEVALPAKVRLFGGSCGLVGACL